MQVEEVRTVAYVIWETKSATAAASYPTRAQALDRLRRTAEASGAEALETFALVHTDHRGHQHVVARGRHLLNLALDRLPQPSAQTFSFSEQAVTLAAAD